MIYRGQKNGPKAKAEYMTCVLFMCVAQNVTKIPNNKANRT